MKIFYLGPEGTNSDLASRAIFDKSFSFVPTNSIEDIFEKVALSHSYYGVIPFIFIQILAIILVFVFPQIATWLPRLIN